MDLEMKHDVKKIKIYHELILGSDTISPGTELEVIKTNNIFYKVFHHSAWWKVPVEYFKQLIFVINGSGGSGKDTFVDFLSKINPRIMSVSSVHEIKHIAKKYFKYDGEKSLKNRKLLSDLKLLQSESCEGPFEFMKNQKELNPDKIIFFHIREPEEIEKFVQYYGKENVKTFLITRKETEKEFGNIADDSIFDYDYDIIIENDSRIEELEKIAGMIYELYIKEKL